MARDNCIPIVILIAGTTVALFDQSSERIQNDLRLKSRPDRRWQFHRFHRDVHNESMASSIQSALDDWADSRVPEHDKKTVLITVMKHHRWLAQLREMLVHIDLARVPVLLIDDEADQASMNTRAGTNDDPSTTYQRIMDLRGAIPHHTFLQYTATPQAPLLINIIDALSPNFVEVLEPGEGYVGGLQFFGNLINTYVRVIPPQDVPNNDNELDGPPQSLLYALQVYMVGVAAHLAEHGDVGQRSMLVHPSRLTASHRLYNLWVSQTFNHWRQTLALPPTDPDRRDLLREFELAFDDLASTTTDIPDFDLITDTLERAFRQTQPIEVNATQGRTPPIPWQNSLGWILVGGQAMDRGFTVEGLTVTYMPRNLGVGNADTVQQRGRFFGYKQEYVGYCRIFLEAGVRDAFHDYVDHEEDVRVQLKTYEVSGAPLNDWKRAFILSQDLRPTRHNVLALDYMRGQFSDQWVHPRYLVAHDDILTHNRAVCGEFLSALDMAEDEGSPDRTANMRHRIATEVPLRSLLEDLLIRFRVVAPTDSQRFTGMMLQIAGALEANSNETCTVYRMRPHTEARRTIKRENGRLKSNLFQGANPSTGQNQGTLYPGDRNLRRDGDLTVQVHTFNLTESRTGPVVAEDIPVIATWLPRRMSAGWVVQDTAAN